VHSCTRTHLVDIMLALTLIAIYEALYDVIEILASDWSALG